MNPAGLGPRVLPVEFPQRNRNLSSSEYTDHSYQLSPPPIVPRRNHMLQQQQQQQQQTANYPGNQSSHVESDEYRNRVGRSMDTPPHLHDSGTMSSAGTYGGHTMLAQSVQDDKTMKQIQEENHFLRLRVEDQAVDVSKVRR